MKAPKPKGLFASVKQFGHEVGLTDRAFARLAIQTCRHAAKGDATPEDAEKILITFNDARRKARGDARLVTKPALQQVSKLRQIIKLGEQYKGAGVKLLIAATDVYLRKIEGKRKYAGEYDSLVAVARFALKSNDVPSVAQIVKLLTR